MKNSIKIISVLVAVTFCFASFSMPCSAIGAETTTAIESTTESTTLSQEDAQKALEENQKALEESLKESEEKLKQLAKTSKETQEYVDTLDQKIGTMNDQLTVLETQVNEYQADIEKLTPQIEENTKGLQTLQKEIDKSQGEIDKLNEKYKNTYDAYCYRLRVMYMSGDYNILTALISCKDVSSFLTRYEMIKSVSKSDTELLKQVTSQMQEITEKQTGLNDKKEEYEKEKTELDAKKTELESKRGTIEKNQEEIAKKKITLSSDRAESDALLAKLTAQNQMYTEFRNEDEEKTQAVENEIQDLINGVKSSTEVTTASTDKNTSSSTTIDYSSSAGVFSKSDAVLNMKYPATGHYTVSAGFPNYSSGKYHGGIDFPCPTGSKIVAAQSGVVLKVKRLDYSYGYYIMIYHGTDKNGRTVVTLYGHNSSILVSAGQTVKKGQQIAKSGSTGNSTGPHCHFEVRIDGSRVNPKYYLSK